MGRNGKGGERGRESREKIEGMERRGRKGKGRGEGLRHGCWGMDAPVLEVVCICMYLGIF